MELARLMGEAREEQADTFNHQVEEQLVPK